MKRYALNGWRHLTGRIKSGSDNDEDFLVQPRNRIHRLDKAQFESWTKESNLRRPRYRFHPVNLFLISYISKEEMLKSFSMLVKKMKHSMLKNGWVKTREQGRVPQEKITEEEIISS